MPTGFRNASGVDLEQLFAPGSGPVADFLRTSSGVGLQFAARTAPKGPDVGYRTSAGVDVSNLWQPTGAASPVTDGGLPAQLVTQNQASGEVSANAFLIFQRDSTVTWSSNSATGSGAWLAAGGAVGGDAYDIRYTAESQSGTGTYILDGADGVRKQLNQNRVLTAQALAPPSQSSSADFTVRIEMWLRSSGQLVLNRTVLLSVNASSTGGG